ncbi:MAG: hypothetical protein K9K82_12260 [Desulfobacteraceae bacterium]|nr:hypothetical protein [Desulfobacteraceae bacterium]
MKKLLVVLLVLGFSAAPAMAVQWDFGASIRTHAGYFDVDQEYVGGPKMDGTIGNFGVDDDSGFLMGLDHNSTFTAKAMVSENFYGVVQLGLRDGDREGDYQNDDYLRLAYGVWNFGAGKLLVGQDYTPGTYLGYSKMSADIGSGGTANLLGAGLPYIARQPQIKLMFGDLDIAFIEQHKGAEDYGQDIDFSLPRIEAAYVFRTDLVNIRPVLGYQSYEIDAVGASEDVDSFLAGIGASFDLSPFYIKGTAAYYQNAGNYGYGNVGNVSALDNSSSILNARVVGDKVKDSDLYIGTLVAGFQVNKMLNLETGFSIMDSEVDLNDDDLAVFNPLLAGTGATGEAEQTAYVYYLQAWISLSKNMHIIPEIGMVDRDDLEVTFDAAGVPKAEVDSGKMTYADVSFRVDF